MEGISDIRIIGIDDLRPPMIRKEPYINLYFKLNHKAPSDWCNDFNRIVSKGQFTVKIEPEEGLYIETWVRKPDEIEVAFEKLKKAIIQCSKEYVERLEAEAQAALKRSGDSLENEGEQGRLNRIIAGLNFDDD